MARVLVIDDDQSVRQVMAKILEHHGHEVDHEVRRPARGHQPHDAVHEGLLVEDVADRAVIVAERGDRGVDRGHTCRDTDAERVGEGEGNTGGIADGSELDAEISLSPMLTEEGSIVLAAGREGSELDGARTATGMGAPSASGP